MMKINIKPNLRQFLTDKIKIQNKNFKNFTILNQNDNLNNQLNSNTNSNKNIGKFSLLNSIKDKDNKNIIIPNNININTNTNTNINNNNANNKNINYNFNNNSFLKENQNDYNKFRKSKTTDKINGNNILIGYQENKNNKNKKIMIKQNTGKMKKYNLSINKIPKYDNSTFNQVIKYYTIKSESKTIQIEDLSTYLRPIRNILGFANKIKTQSNISSSININNHYNKKYNNNNIKENKENKENKEKENKDKESIKNEDKESIKNEDKESIKNEDEDKDKDNDKKIVEKEMNNNDIKEENNLKQNNNNDIKDDKNDLTFGKHKNINSSINLNDNNISTMINKNVNNVNYHINTSLIKNCVFNNISHTQRNNKFYPIPFNIKIDKINNIKTNNDNNNIIDNNTKEINTNSNTYNNVINSKNMDEIDTQISTNNNLNNKNSKDAFNQFRPRKMNLPKSGINLSSMQFKNKILQNILNKRKQNK